MTQVEQVPGNLYNRVSELLRQARSFYLVYSKGQTVSDEFTLSWSHYLNLMWIDDVQERRFYEIEAYKNNWK